MQSLTTGMSNAATFTSGQIVVSIMTVGLGIAFLVGCINFRAGVWVAGTVVAAGVGASIAPNFASSIYTWFHGGGVGAA